MNIEQKNSMVIRFLSIATTETDFTLWLKKESWGFSEGVGHYLIITLNDIVDIASVFPPQEIIINKKNNNLKANTF